MNKFSIVNNYWNKKYAQCPEMDDDMEYSDEEESYEHEETHGDQELSEVEPILEEAESALENLVEANEQIESAELHLVLNDAWSAGDVTMDDLSDEEMAHTAKFTDEKGNKHTLASSMWMKPEEDVYE